jgi:hypothetical protein
MGRVGSQTSSVLAACDRNRRKDGFRARQWAAPDSRVRDLGVVHPPELVFLPGRKSMVPYSIRWLMRLKPAWFPPRPAHIARPTAAEEEDQADDRTACLSARRGAHELLGSGGVIGKIMLVPNG